MSIRTKLAAVVSTAAIAAVGLGAAATPAGAATADQAPAASKSAPAHTQPAATYSATAGTASLSIRYIGGGYYSVTVSGKANIPTTSMTGNMSVELWGDDTFFDQFVDSSFWYTTTSDGYFYASFKTTGALLNEDWGQDEIYALVDVWYAPHQSVRIKSNVVSGSY